MMAVTDCENGNLSDLSRQILEAQQILQQHLTGIERALRNLTLAAAQTNAEVILQCRRFDMLDGRLSRLEAILTASRRAE